MPKKTRAKPAARSAEEGAGGQLQLVGGLLAALGAVAAGWLLLLRTAGTAADAEVKLECGPPDTEHFSEQPAQGLHVLQVAGGVPCEDGASTFSVNVHIDGCLASSSAEAASASASWEAGTVVDIDTEDGWEYGATVTGPATSGNAAERQVRFADGTEDDWDTSDFRLSGHHGTLIELQCAPSDAAGIQEWLVAPVRQLVPRLRPLLHHQLMLSGALRPEAVENELQARPGLDRWAAFTPHGTAIPASASEVLRAFHECGTIYLIEGGMFVWPGVRPGHNWTVTTSTASPVGSGYSGKLTITTLALQPRLFTVEPLLTEAERQWIIEQSPSAQAPGARTPGTTIKDKEALAVIERRMHAIVHMPESHGEDVQIMKYSQGDQCETTSRTCVVVCSGVAVGTASVWSHFSLLHGSSKTGSSFFTRCRCGVWLWGLPSSVSTNVCVWIHLLQMAIITITLLQTTMRA